MVGSTQSELRRKDYLLLRLDNKTDKVAKKKLGIKGKQFSERLKAALNRDCTLSDAHRSGRPRVYTSEVLDWALDWFQQNAWRMLKMATFVAELKEVGILPSSAKAAGFSPAFHAHCARLGLHLKWGQQSLTFALSHQHEIWRYSWCLAMENAFVEPALWGFTFCDEITIEETGHPKDTSAATAYDTELQLQQRACVGLSCCIPVAQEETLLLRAMPSKLATTGS